MKRLSQFALYPQDAPDWCWAAVVQMLQHHYLSTWQSQAEIVRRCNGRRGCVTSHTDGESRRCSSPCLDGLVWQATGRNRPLRWELLCAELDADRPVVITWQGHSVVCIGYDPIGRALIVYNPLPVGRGRVETLPYHDYAGLFNSESWYGIRLASHIPYNPQ